MIAQKTVRCLFSSLGRLPKRRVTGARPQFMVALTVAALAAMQAE
jgi:hypothetical protein